MRPYRHTTFSKVEVLSARHVWWIAALIFGLAAAGMLRDLPPTFEALYLLAGCLAFGALVRVPAVLCCSRDALFVRLGGKRVEIDGEEVAWWRPLWSATHQGHYWLLLRRKGSPVGGFWLVADDPHGHVQTWLEWTGVRQRGRDRREAA